MTNKISYKTKQKEELAQFLASVRGEHITASDVYAHFQSRGQSMGMTTIYRHLERMVDEGLVNKYIIDANSPACFEFVSRDEHTHEGSCFHCKCEDCGRLIHLHCEELDGIKKHISEHHGFSIDPFRTVFYGKCSECATGS